MKLNYFNFKNFKEQMLLTNDFGRYLFVSKENFQDILSLKIEKNLISIEISLMQK